MKAFVASRLLLLLPLLISLMWRCSGLEPVLVKCNHFRLRVIAKRVLFHPDERIDPDEMFLGTGCQVIYVRPDELEFDYPVGLCGITAGTENDRTVIYSWLTYKSKNVPISAMLKLQCVVPSPYVMDDPKMLIQDLRAQCWFLIQIRNCNSCGHYHFYDNWSTPFHGLKNYSRQRF